MRAAVDSDRARLQRALVNLLDRGAEQGALEPAQLGCGLWLGGPDGIVVVVGRQIFPAAAVVPDVHQVVLCGKVLDAPLDEAGEHLRVAAIDARHPLERLELVLLHAVPSGLVFLGVELDNDVDLIGGTDPLHLREIVASGALQIVVSSHVH